MQQQRPFAWERHYPEGARWDAPVPVGTLPGLLDRSAAAFGPRPAIEFRGRRISYAELKRRADRFAAGLIGMGVGPGQSVALYFHNTPFHPIALFGALRTGARVVQLSPLDPPMVLKRKIADSGARMVIGSNVAALFDQAMALRDAVKLVLGDDADWGMPSTGRAIPEGVARFEAIDADPLTAWPALSPDDVALLQYTGGSTGLPRAAMLCHVNLTAAAASFRAWGMAQGMQVTPEDRVIGVLPLFHIFAFTGVLLLALEGGAEILLRPRFDAAQTLDDIEKRRATMMAGVPTMWLALNAQADIDRRDLSSLRSAASGGAPLPADVAARFELVTGRRLGGGWGMTETSPCGTAIPPGMAYRAGMIGVPLPGVEMGVVALDDPHRVLPPGVVGELRVRGPNVTAGYWNRPEENAAAYADGFFLTGDVGTMDADGVFFIVDRKKDMIISGGFNVYPAVIENALHAHPDVAEAAVIGIPDPYRGQAAKAYVVLRPGVAGLTLEGIDAFLRERLGKHEMPVALEVREALPKTAVGKLARRELVDEERARAQAGV
jgi:long-chain acyl-CoA synthetase